MLICRQAWTAFKIPAKVEYEASAEMVPDLILASYFFGPQVIWSLHENAI